MIKLEEPFKTLSSTYKIKREADYRGNEIGEPYIPCKNHMKIMFYNKDKYMIYFPTNNTFNKVYQNINDKLVEFAVGDIDSEYLFDKADLDYVANAVGAKIRKKRSEIKLKV